MVEEAAPRRGDIWLCNLGGSAGVRPVAVVSADALNEVRAKVIVAMGTTKRRGIRTEVPVGRDEGLRKEGVVSSADLATVPKSALLRRAGRLSGSKYRLLDDALELALSLPVRE